MTNDDFEKRLLDDSQSVITRIRAITYILAILVIFGFTKVVLWHWGWDQVFIATRKNACVILVKHIRERNVTITEMRAKVAGHTNDPAFLGTRVTLEAKEDEQIADSMRLMKYMDQLQAMNRQQVTSTEDIPLLLPFTTQMPDLPLALAITFLGASLLLWVQAGQLRTNVDKWISYLKDSADDQVKTIVSHCIRTAGPVFGPLGALTVFIILSTSTVILGLFIISDVADYYSRYMDDPILRAAISDNFMTTFYFREVSLGFIGLLIFTVAIIISVKASRIGIELNKIK